MNTTYDHMWALHIRSTKIIIYGKSYTGSIIYGKSYTVIYVKNIYVHIWDHIRYSYMIIHIWYHIRKGYTYPDTCSYMNIIYVYHIWYFIYGIIYGTDIRYLDTCSYMNIIYVDHIWLIICVIIYVSSYTKWMCILVRTWYQRMMIYN